MSVLLKTSKNSLKWISFNRSIYYEWGKHWLIDGTTAD